MPPPSLFSSHYREQVIALLLLHPERSYHVREVARLTGLAAAPVGRELNKLADVCVLTRTRVGNQVQFQANQHCPIYPELVGIAQKTFGLTEPIAKALGPFSSQLVVAFIFGSVATGRATAASDIDLMLIGNVDFDSVIVALAATESQLMREVSPKIYGVAEWRAQSSADDAFLQDVLSKPKIFIKGDDEVLRALSTGVNAP